VDRSRYDTWSQEPSTLFCEATRLIPAPPDKIWPLLIDLTRLNEWLPVKAEITLPPGVTQAAPGVIVNVKRQTQLGMVDLEQIFGLCDAPRMLTWRNQNERLDGKPITQVKDFAATISLVGEAGGRSRITARATWTPVGIMGTAASALMKPRMQKEFEQALENIEKLMLQP